MAKYATSASWKVAEKMVCISNLNPATATDRLPSTTRPHGPAGRLLEAFSTKRQEGYERRLTEESGARGFGDLDYRGMLELALRGDGKK